MIASLSAGNGFRPIRVERSHQSTPPPKRSGQSSLKETTDRHRSCSGCRPPGHARPMGDAAVPYRARESSSSSLPELLRRDAEKLAALESRDNGKPIRDTRSEVRRAADWLTFFAGAADKIYGEQIPFRPDALAYTRREPVGVVEAIAPWNSPRYPLHSWKLGPALAAGNIIVLKPAEQTSGNGAQEIKASAHS